MKEKKVIMSSVFQTKEQEELFAKCARDRINTGAKLKLDDEIGGKVIMSSVFQTKEQEELFTKCARDRMNTDAKLKLDEDIRCKKKVLKNIKGVVPNE